jgi:hypothetical protein
MVGVCRKGMATTIEICACVSESRIRLHSVEHDIEVHMQERAIFDDVRKMVPEALAMVMSSYVMRLSSLRVSFR